MLTFWAVSYTHLSYTVTESAAPDLTNYYLTTPTADRTQ